MNLVFLINFLVFIQKEVPHFVFFFEDYSEDIRVS